MDDVTHRDRTLLVREFLNVPRLVGVAAALGFTYLIATVAPEKLAEALGVIGAAVTIAVYINTVVSEAKRKRFIQKRYEALWSASQDRLNRFEEVFRKMRKEQVADLTEMPKTIRSVAAGLYRALRRADMISDEIMKTERGLYIEPPGWNAGATDAQATELYRIADKNIAEYKQQYAGVMAGVHRAEAQSAVFMTTLDNLRMKMLGYRLVGKTPEVPSRDFLEALSEAKLQLDAIDKALDELDLSILPKTIAVIRTPEDAQNEIEQR